MLNRHIEEIAGRYGIFVIYLFGSQAEVGKRYLDGGDVTPDAFSDLDVSVAFITPPDEVIRTYGELYKEFSDIFDPFNIDLIFMHEVHSLFQYEIIKGIRIYEQDINQADELEEGIMKKAEDLFFRKQTFDKDVMEAIEGGYFEFEYSPNS